MTGVTAGWKCYFFLANANIIEIPRTSASKRCSSSGQLISLVSNAIFITIDISIAISIAIQHHRLCLLNLIFNWLTASRHLHPPKDNGNFCWKHFALANFTVCLPSSLFWLGQPSLDCNGFLLISAYIMSPADLGFIDLLDCHPTRLTKCVKSSAKLAKYINTTCKLYLAVYPKTKRVYCTWNGQMKYDFIMIGLEMSRGKVNRNSNPTLP